MNVVAFDTEARGLDWWDAEHAAFLYSWADADGEYHAAWNDAEAVGRFHDAICNADTIVAHNLPYDVHQVRETLGLDILGLGARLIDTALCSRVLHPSGQTRVLHGLKDLAQIYLRHDAKEEEDAIKEMAKAIGLRTIKQTGAYYEVWRAYPEVMEAYARMDARHTYDLWALWEPQLRGDDLKVFELECAVQPILIRAEQRGVWLDPDKVQELKAQYEAIEREERAWLDSAFGSDVWNGEGSVQALLDALLAQGVPLYRKTKSGESLSTDAYALSEFEDEYPVIGHLQEWRRVTKFLKTYIGVMDGETVLHPSFWQLGAWTGRMSCSRPNLQNFPKRAGKEVRAALVPRPGHAFVALDYESIESYLLAHYLGDADYRELVKERDPHAWMATHLWGGEVSDYVKGSPGEESRNKAKNGTYAICYGAGGNRITDMFKLDPGPFFAEDSSVIINARAEGREWPKAGWQYHEARALIRKIKAALPNWNVLQRRIRNKVETLGYVNTAYGRKQVVSKEKSYVGLNALIQGTAADVFKLGLVAVAEAVRPYGAVPILFVHDEIVCECRVEVAENVKLAMATAMTSPGDLLNLSPRLSVEGSITEENYACA